MNMKIHTYIYVGYVEGRTRDFIIENETIDELAIRVRYIESDLSSEKKKKLNHIIYDNYIKLLQE